MNKVILMGRLTRDPNISYSSGERQTTVARYTLAVDRRRRSDGGEQGQAVSNIFKKAGLTPQVVTDYSGHNRIVSAAKE